MVGFFDDIGDTASSLLGESANDNDTPLTSSTGIYSTPSGSNPLNDDMTPGGGAFTLGQWGNMLQTRADTAAAQGWTPDNDNSLSGDGTDGSSDPQVAQGFPPSIFARPPTLPPDYVTPEVPPEMVKPPLPEIPPDPTKPPAPGWEWRGAPGSQPGDGNGNWYNPETGESLHPDMDHGPPQGPHWDYKPGKPSPEYPNEKGYRWYPDGRMEPKKSIIPPDVV